MDLVKPEYNFIVHLQGLFCVINMCSLFIKQLLLFLILFNSVVLLSLYKE